MPGRTFLGSDNYRYSVNGMEKSPEIASGHNTSYFRELDARTGRWWSVDPVWQPWQSSYNTFDNNPVALSDPHGNCTDCGGEGSGPGDGGTAPGSSSQGGMIQSEATNSFEELVIATKTEAQAPNSDLDRVLEGIDKTYEKDDPTAANLRNIVRNSPNAVKSIMDYRNNGGTGNRAKARGYVGQAIASSTLDIAQHEVLVKDGEEEYNVFVESYVEFLSADYITMTVPLFSDKKESDNVFYSHRTLYSSTSNKTFSSNIDLSGSKAGNAVVIDLYEIKTTSSVYSTATSFEEAVTQLRAKMTSSRILNFNKGRTAYFRPIVVMDADSWDAFFNVEANSFISRFKQVTYGFPISVFNAMTDLKRMNGGLILIEGLTKQAEIELNILIQNIP